MSYQQEKKLVLDYFEALDNAKNDEKKVQKVLNDYMSSDYTFRCSHPFREIDQKKESIVKEFWMPLKKSLSKMRRRQDVFIAGDNEVNSGEKWVMSMGHFEGRMEDEWLGIKPNYKLAHLRYAEFTQVKDGKIVSTGLFFDLIGFMLQTGVNPLPMQAGNYFVYTGPRDHNGLLFKDADPKEGKITQDLMNQMVADLDVLNKTNQFPTKQELLDNNRKTWDEEMIWYGPAGIGAQYMISGYINGHQYPFRHGLKDKVFNGHVCRFAEGNFSCFFGWPNLSNKAIGGFMGLPGGEVSADMQVVDVYYRKGDKLYENWVIIDMPHWLNMQGLDILKRNEELMNKSDL